MIPTRPTPPWVPANHYLQTFLEKTVGVRYVYYTPPPMILDDPNGSDIEQLVEYEEWTNGS
mgnify:FL=1